jgi:hypothetical protein
MPTPERSLSVDVLREAVRSAVKASGQRQVARDIGMSATGLRAFLKGGEPFEATRQKLTAWYVRTAQERGEHTSPATARAALGILLEGLPEKEREELEAEFLRALAAKWRALRRSPPEWLRDLKG